MNTKKSLFAGTMLIALAGAGVLISGSQNVAKAGPGATQVSIMSPLPLPITGTATVSGTVGATQSGAWNVGISGTPTVNVGAMPAVSINGTPTVNVGSIPAVSLAGTPTVNIGGSTGALATQDLSTFASQNVLLQNRTPANTSNFFGMLALSGTGTLSNCCYVVPAGKTLVVTSVDIAPVNPGPGTNHIYVYGTQGSNPEIFRHLEVPNASSTHLDYPTGIAFGSAEQIIIFNGAINLNSTVSAGDVDVYLQGYLTSN